MRATKHRFSALWILTLHAYFPLGTLASYKSAWELVTNPFYWDKTSHGHFDGVAPPDAAPQRVRSTPASTRSRVS